MQSAHSHPAFKAVSGILLAALMLGLFEASLRLAGFHYQAREKLLYKPTVTGFIDTEQFFLQTAYAAPGYLWRSEADPRFTDSNGFRLPEVPVEKSAGKIRIAFLGGSTTQGGYRPYPERTVRLLNQALGTNRYEMLNAACSSYTIHQSLMAFDRWVRPRHPDILVVYHGWNETTVFDDGFSDKEKDRLVMTGISSSHKMMQRLRQLRLFQLLAGSREAFDTSWPRQRVAFSEFESGLQELVSTAQEDGIRVIIVKRPSQKPDALNRPLIDPDSVAGEAIRRDLGTLNTTAVYQEHAHHITAIQERVFRNNSEAELFDAESVIENLTTLNAQGLFGENIRVFRSDDCHLYEFADELMAQQLAMHIAPDLQTALSNRIASVDYLTSIGAELIDEGAPREAAWFLKSAAEREPRNDHIMQLLESAKRQFLFYDHFRAGRSGGTEQDADQKIEHLKACLAMRSDDYGVLFQLYFVCLSMNRGAVFAPASATFTPGSYEHESLYWKMLLESHLVGERWAEARAAAARVILFDPGHELALRILDQS